MKKDYSLLIFNCNTLIFVDSPTEKIFNINIFSLKGKSIDELFNNETILQLNNLELNKKTSLKICTFDGVVLDVYAVKNKFESIEILNLYFKSPLGITNTKAPDNKRTILDELLNDNKTKFIGLIDQLSTTRNKTQIKDLKNNFFEFLEQMNHFIYHSMTQVPIKKNENNFYTFNFTQAVEEVIEKYKNRVIFECSNIKTNYVIGNRDKLLELLEKILEDYTSFTENIYLKLLVNEKYAILDITNLNENFLSEMGDDFTSLNPQNQDRTVLSREAGCILYKYMTPNKGEKTIIACDITHSYKLYEKVAED